MIVRSNLIVIGTISPPIEQIEANQRSNKHDYVPVPVSVIECLKGSACPTSLVLRYYTQQDNDRPKLKELIATKGLRVILFLVQGDDADDHKFYFDGASALRGLSPELSLAIEKEIALQTEVPAFLRAHFDPEKDASFARVKFLIDETTTTSERQKKAFSELEKMGQLAVPSMIMLMDDQRHLAERAISLANNFPNAFEGIRHYSPVVVTDAMVAILNQITGENFGSVHNGGSDAARRAAVDGWRTYLYYQLRTSAVMRKK